MFGWLFGKSRVWYKDDELLIIRFKSLDGVFYIGSFDTEINFVETKDTLEAVGRMIEVQPQFRNSFFTDFERLGYCLHNLGFETTRTIGPKRAWFFERAPSTVFVSNIKPCRSAYQLRNTLFFARSKKTLDAIIERAVLGIVTEMKESKD